MQFQSEWTPTLRPLLRPAEAAARRNDIAGALRGFMSVGDAAVTLEKWRSAVRGYRAALELDLLRREPIAALLRLGPHLAHEHEWREYRRALEGTPDWPHFGCRSARIITSDSGSIVECNVAGPVCELIMARHDLVEAHPVERYAKMPLAMGLLIMRRALWITPRFETPNPSWMRVAFGGRAPVWLNEQGDWEASRAGA
ncbi:MAG TPA: hypothetical protein VMJ10_29720 [Kofleriaceae bacterium]|nr:hypothetical protein [Kofleriaceae bacterium]